MTHDKKPQICMISFPFHCSKDTGRGLDRVLYEWVRLIPTRPDTVRLNLLDQGFSRSVQAAALKSLNFVCGLLFARADLYHALTFPRTGGHSG